MNNPQLSNEVSIGIACPDYDIILKDGEGIRRIGRKRFDEVQSSSISHRHWEWKYKESIVNIYLRENDKEDGRTRYNKNFTCPYCRAELLLSVGELIKLYQFSENEVRHHIRYKGVSTNTLYRKNGGFYLGEVGLDSRHIDAISIPKDYLPKHPELFNNEWKVRNVEALDNIENLSDNEIAILLAVLPRQTVSLLNDANTGVEIAKRLLRLDPYNVHRSPLPIPDSSELLSAMIPFLDGNNNSNLKTALLSSYDTLGMSLFKKSAIFGACSFAIALALLLLPGYPVNVIVSLLTLIVVANALMFSELLSLDEVKTWQKIVKWLPENKYLKRTKLLRIIFVLVQVVFLIFSLRYMLLK